MRRPGTVRAITDRTDTTDSPTHRFQADVGAPVQDNGLTLRDTEEGDLFVGELAARQGRPGAVRSPRDRDRVADPIVTYLTDAAFAALLPDVNYARVKVVTGLPVDYYRDAEALAAHLKGTHHVKLDDRRLLVDVEEVRVLPQPFGGLLSMLLDDYRVSYEPHQLEAALRWGWLVVDGQTVRLNGLASDRLATIAGSIEARARTLWNISTLSAIVLAGGGSLALRWWLEPYFRQAIFAPDAAMANVHG
jgi:hypothetical protein